MEGRVETEVECDLMNGTLCIATVRIDFRYKDCECSSEAGNQWVTERWQEIDILKAEILEYKIYDEDCDEKVEVFLTSQEREEVIETAKQDFIESEQ